MRARENPFRTSQLEKLEYCFESGDFEGLMDRLERMKCRGALVGPEGSGKTTLLRQIESSFVSWEVPVVKLICPRDKPTKWSSIAQFRTIMPTTVALVDGADNLPIIAWVIIRILTRNWRGLVITTHKPGRLPTLWTCRATPDLLEHLTAQLATTDSNLLRCLFEKHGGNIRAIFLEMYDRLAGA